jgi:hypothetical protein
MASSDKIWAQILIPPILTLFWFLGALRILSLARAGGELEQDRPKLLWYGALVLLVVMYAAWFHFELATHWKWWAVVFASGLIFLAVMYTIRRTSGSEAIDRWGNIFVGWLICNAMGMVVVSIFRYFGN